MPPACYSGQRRPPVRVKVGHGQNLPEQRLARAKVSQDRTRGRAGPRSVRAEAAQRRGRSGPGLVRAQASQGRGRQRAEARLFFPRKPIPPIGPTTDDRSTPIRGDQSPPSPPTPSAPTPVQVAAPGPPPSKAPPLGASVLRPHRTARPATRAFQRPSKNASVTTS